MKLVLEIELGNDGMQTAGEIIDSTRRSLVSDASSLFDPLIEGETGAILDGNGNTVGKWEVVADAGH